MDIFVGSLPFKLDENGLREIFEKFGEVSSVTIIINKATRLKKGFGFVVMPDEKQALEAIASLNGTEVMGRAIEVKKSEDKRDVEKKAPKRIVKKKGPVSSVPKEKNNYVWPRKLFPSKKKKSVVDYPGIIELKEKKAREAEDKPKRKFKPGSKKRGKKG